MLATYLAFAAFVAVPAVGVPALARRFDPRRTDAVGSRAAARWRAARTALVARMGTTGAVIAVVLVGAALTIGLGWIVGEALAAVEDPIDLAVFDWAAANQEPVWVEINAALTLMGGRTQAKIACALAVLPLMYLWRPRLWVPPLVIAVGYGLERWLQELLAAMVDRGHPPTTLGTYPSGGCARILAVYGTIFLLVTSATRLSRRWRVTGWTVLAVAAGVEGYTRYYLLKHWVTDAVGGWVFGAMVLVVVAAVISVVSPSPRGGRPTLRDHAAASRHHATSLPRR